MLRLSLLADLTPGSFPPDLSNDLYNHWNVRGINTQGVLERTMKLKKLHQLSIITILEPFYDIVHVQSFKVHLNMDNATTNCNGKIRVFLDQ